MTILDDKKPLKQDQGPPAAREGPPSYDASTSAAGGTTSADLDLITCSSTSAPSAADPLESFATATSSRTLQADNSDELNLEARKGDTPVDVPDEEPPDFAPYHAVYKIDTEGDITTLDPHLNIDGEALAQFLIMHLRSPPQVSVRVVGTHQETRTEFETHYDKDGRARTHTKEVHTTVTDFDFTLPVTAHPACPSDAPIAHSHGDATSGVADALASPAGRLHVVTDDELVGRGGRRRAKAAREGGQDCALWHAPGYEPRKGSGGVAGKVKVSGRERSRARGLASRIKQLGLPPFLPAWLTFAAPGHHVPPGLEPPSDATLATSITDLRSQHMHGMYHLDCRPREGAADRETRAADSAAVRAWCDEYCADKRWVKSLVARKAVYGWNLDAIEQGIKDMIREEGYPHNLSITISTSSSLIVVRPPNLIARILDAPWYIKVLLTLLGLIYPVAWLIDALFGAEYDVLRCSFPLVSYVPAPATTSDLLGSGGASSSSHRDADFVDARGQKWVLRGEPEASWLGRIRPNLQAHVQPALSRIRFSGSGRIRI